MALNRAGMVLALCEHGVRPESASTSINFVQLATPGCVTPRHTASPSPKPFGKWFRKPFRRDHLNLLVNHHLEPSGLGLGSIWVSPRRRPWRSRFEAPYACMPSNKSPVSRSRAQGLHFAAASARRRRTPAKSTSLPPRRRRGPTRGRHSVGTMTISSQPDASRLNCGG